MWPAVLCFAISAFVTLVYPNFNSIVIQNVELRMFVCKVGAKSHTTPVHRGSLPIQRMLGNISFKIYNNNRLVTKVTDYSSLGCRWNYNIVTKYQGLRQIILIHVEKIDSYLRGRKMAERKKEVEVRWIVGYVWTSQWPNRWILRRLHYTRESSISPTTEKLRVDKKMKLAYLY